MYESAKLMDKNAKLYALFLFQYALTIPLMSYISSSIIIAAISLFLVFLIFVTNKGVQINIKVFLFILIMASVLLIKTLISNGSFALIINYAIYAVVPMLMMLFPFDTKTFFAYGYKLAVLNFFINVLNPFMPKYNYMRFGYGMLLTFIFLYIEIRYHNCECVKWRKMLSILLLVLSSIEIFVYGARGAFFSLVLFLALDIFIVNGKRLFTNICFILVAVVAYFNIVPILDLLYEISLKIGIGSYAIAKYRMQLSDGWAVASSGRNKLYSTAIEKIKEHPFVGNPIDESLEDGEYVHNLFLQLAQDFGLIALCVLIVFLVYTLFLMMNSKISNNSRVLLAVLFAISIGRLMFSSIIWQRPEFWMFICFSMCIGSKKETYQVSNYHLNGMT